MDCPALTLVPPADRPREGCSYGLSSLGFKIVIVARAGAFLRL